MLKPTRVCFTAEIAKHAEKIFMVCALSVLCGSFRLAAGGAPPVRTMYNDAMAKEQAVRPELDAPESAASVLVHIHAAIAAYEALVRHYPASGYCDYALWQAGRLSLDAFGRFKQSADRELGVRLLRRLAAQYPTSKLAKQVPDQLARVDASDDPSMARPKAPQPAAAPVKAQPPTPSPVKTTVTTRNVTTHHVVRHRVVKKRVTHRPASRVSQTTTTVTQKIN